MVDLLTAWCSLSRRHCTRTVSLPTCAHVEHGKNVGRHFKIREVGLLAGQKLNIRFSVCSDVSSARSPAGTPWIYCDFLALLTRNMLLPPRPPAGRTGPHHHGIYQPLDPPPLVRRTLHPTHRPINPCRWGDILGISKAENFGWVLAQHWISNLQRAPYEITAPICRRRRRHLRRPSTRFGVDPASRLVGQVPRGDEESESGYLEGENWAGRWSVKAIVSSVVGSG